VHHMPPGRFEAHPYRFKLPAGTALWRVHHRDRGPTEFTPAAMSTRAGVGGRFDGTADDPFHFYYAAKDPGTALAERFLREVPFADTGVRHIRVAETTADLELVSLLDEEALAAVAADSWLIHADSSGYPATRRWAAWIRRQAPWAQGLVWPAKRRTGKEAVVLFRDRCPDVPLVVRATSVVDLDDEIGAAWINALLAPFRAKIDPPHRRVAR
jgi:RES domain-containing protein